LASCRRLRERRGVERLEAAREVRFAPDFPVLRVERAGRLLPRRPWAVLREDVLREVERAVVREVFLRVVAMRTPLPPRGYSRAGTT
ncbi:MAG TPA: hypothetical protein VHI93_00465, partial [Candidatus Thermoplasmatota archaeon]|nr:hypothetical protein [Candidatus Thermoplasmatota archaeon]